MSPEQTRGSRLDYRTDLYSLGVMIYESATGGVPFTGSSIAIMSQHAGTPPEPPAAAIPGISEELEALDPVAAGQAARGPARSGAAVGRGAARGDRADPAPAPARPTAPRTPRPIAEPSPMPRPVRPRRRPRPSLAASWTDGISPVALGKPDGRPRMGKPQHGPPATRRRGRARATGRAAATAGSARRPGPLAAGPADARGRPGRADRPVGRGALPARPLSGLPPERLAAPRVPLAGPLEPRNADRARLLLGLTYAIWPRADDEAIQRCRRLLDQRIEVRPSLSPIVVAKYLPAATARPGASSSARRARPSEASALRPEAHDRRQGRAQPRPDAAAAGRPEPARPGPRRGRRRPGRAVEPGRRGLARPARFPHRRAPLRHQQGPPRPGQHGLLARGRLPLDRAGPLASPDPSRTEAIWDYLAAGSSTSPTPASCSTGPRPRRPAPWSPSSTTRWSSWSRTPGSTTTRPIRSPADEADRLTASLSRQPSAWSSSPPSRASPTRTRACAPGRPRPAPVPPGSAPRALEGGLKALQSRPGAGPGQAGQPPARPGRPLSADRIPSIRGRAAGQIAIQGMANKQIELTTPTFRTKGSAGKPSWPSGSTATIASSSPTSTS